MADAAPRAPAPPTASPAPDETLLSALQRVADTAAADDDGVISIAELRHALGERLYGPMLLLGAALQLLPTGLVIGVTDFVAILATFVGLQIALGRAHPWLPDWLLQRTVSRASLEQVASRFEPWARRGDTLFKRRLSVLVTGPAALVVGLACVLLGILIFLFGFVPGLANLPAAALAFFAVGLTVRDGLANLIGLVILVVALLVSAFVAGVIYGQG